MPGRRRISTAAPRALPASIQPASSASRASPRPKASASRSSRRPRRRHGRHKPRWSNNRGCVAKPAPRDRRGEQFRRRAAPRARRDRDDDRLRALKGLLETGVPSGAVEDISLDPSGSKRGDALLRPRRAARLDRRRPPDQRLGAITNPEEEDFHVRTVIPEGLKANAYRNCALEPRAIRFHITDPSWPGFSRPSTRCARGKTVKCDVRVDVRVVKSSSAVHGGRWRNDHRGSARRVNVDSRTTSQT